MFDGFLREIRFILGYRYLNPAPVSPSHVFSYKLNNIARFLVVSGRNQLKIE